MPGNGFVVIHSNDLENLASVAAAQIRQHPLSDPFASEQILVMNLGMRTFLSQVIARCNGIEARCDYLQIWQLIFRIHRIVNFRADKRNLFSRMHLALNILGLRKIWGSSKARGFERMREYIRNDETSERAFELAARIADTFDQYQMYRPEWIRAWNSFTEEDFVQYEQNPEANGKIKQFLHFASSRGGVPGQRKLLEIWRANLWQIRLWCLLRSNFMLCDAQSRLPLSEDRAALLLMDRAEVMAKLKRDLLNPNLTIRGLPERIFVFGVSALPRQVIDFLQALGHRAEVYLLLLNPCAQYWGDIHSSWKDFFDTFRHKLLQSKIAQHQVDVQAVSVPRRVLQEQTLPAQEVSEQWWDAEGELVEGNSLLLSLGKQGRDNLEMLLELDPVPAFVNFFSQPEPDNLLHAIQWQLLSLHPAEHRDKPVIRPDDSSVQIHCCHTILREVEVLRDAILRRFKEARENGYRLLPRDIVVMVPAINKYAPYIAAVFGSTEAGDANYIPYVISDRTEAESSMIAHAVLTLLDIGSKRVTAATVIDLLSIEQVAAKFSIAPSDVPVLESYLRESGILWGLDAAETQQESEIDLPCTFDCGTDRMLAGIMGGDLPELGSYDSIEGDDAVLTGNFCAFISKLRTLRQIFTPNLTLEPLQWTQYLYRYIFDNFFEQDDTFLSEIASIGETVTELQNVCLDFKDKPHITLPVFKAILQQSLNARRDYTPFLRDKVNFGSLIPMRAVPFKHIFVLGLNDSDFPRQERTPGFNLMSVPELFERGDRSRGIDDRFLFLETLISARDSIYFSYIGESPVSQQELNPSVVLSELTDYISDNFRVDGQTDSSPADIMRRLCLKEHLTAYHADNFRTIRQAGMCPRYPSFDGSYLLHRSKELRDSPVLGAFANWGVQVPAEKMLEISQLSSFLSAPASSFLHEVLHIDASVTQTEDTPVREDFDRDAFANAPAVSALLSQAESEDKAFFREEDLKARQPFGIFGRINADKIEGIVQPMRQALLRECSLHSLSELKEEHVQSGPHSVAGCNFTLSCKVYFPAVSCSAFIKIQSPKKFHIPLLMRAFCQQLGIYLRYGQTQKVLLLDNAGQVFYLQPLPAEKMQQALQLALAFYVQGMQRPLPVCNSMLKAYVSLDDEDREAGNFESCFEGEFMYEDDMRYLFGSPAAIGADENLRALFLSFADFYRQYIWAGLSKAE